MALPNVLLIGAMKSGTTGLYMDLATHPNVFLAQDKEPQCLCSDDVLTQEGLRQYAKRYAGAREGQVICDASTNYAKRPDYDGVVQRALKVLPEGFKVIYIVRHPIERILSQHRHEYGAGLVSEDVNNDVRRHSRYLDYSSYAYQLQPWIEAVGRERIQVVRFEDYVARRREALESVCEFLGLAPHRCQIRQDKIHNQSTGKPVSNTFWNGVARHPFYKTVLRKLLSPKLRLEIYRWILPSVPEKSSEPASETLAWLRQSLVDDVQQLSKLLDRNEPLWTDFVDVGARPTRTACALSVSSERHFFKTIRHR